MPTYDDELVFARELAVAAGEVLLRHFGAALEVQMKGWADPVTVADRESEAVIEAAIGQRFPGDGVDGEELGRRSGTSGRIWIVDPLDGTANYSGGMPIFAVVLTLVDASDPRVALLNVTYDPVRHELFQATRGGGACLNGRRVQASAHDDLSRALIHLHFSNKRQLWKASMELARRVTFVSPHARDIGSTALAQAYVAAGRLDGHVKVQSGTWDVVGGNLLVEEAGGIVTDLAGGPWQYGGTLCAAGPSLHPKLVDVVNQGDVTWLPR